MCCIVYWPSTLGVNEAAGASWLPAFDSRLHWQRRRHPPLLSSLLGVASSFLRQKLVHCFRDGGGPASVWFLVVDYLLPSNRHLEGIYCSGVYGSLVSSDTLSGQGHQNWGTRWLPGSFVPCHVKNIYMYKIRETRVGFVWQAPCCSLSRPLESAGKRLGNKVQVRASNPGQNWRVVPDLLSCFLGSLQCSVRCLYTSQSRARSPRNDSECAVMQ
jgi:hypothetical protein